MAKKCPSCGSNNTKVLGPRKMLCEFCAHKWTTYKHSGKKMKRIPGLIIGERRIMPGAKTKLVKGLFSEKRVKKSKKPKILRRKIWR